jgi:hypothetical protein
MVKTMKKVFVFLPPASSLYLPPYKFWPLKFCPRFKATQSGIVLHTFASRSYLTMGDKDTNSSKATLVRPPPIDPQKSAIENVLELTELGDIGPVYSSQFTTPDAMLTT